MTTSPNTESSITAAYDQLQDELQGSPPCATCGAVSTCDYQSQPACDDCVGEYERDVETSADHCRLQLIPVMRLMATETSRVSRILEVPDSLK